MPRTFIAIPLPHSVIAALEEAQRQLAAAGADVRWVERENLHLTLKFLGQVEDRHVTTVCTVAQQAAGSVEAFDFDVRGLTSVPPSGQMRMVWAGVADDTGKLAVLHDQLDSGFAGMGFQEETRDFRPHMTLGRVKGGRNITQLRSAVSRYVATDFGPCPADELVVFSSQLAPSGPIYTPLAKAPLK
jgi:2'-5' RNA ligase